MASPLATSVRPPRPKKEPQTLVIPKNAAEEQKLKLERLMKNPVSGSGLYGPAEPLHPAARLRIAILSTPRAGLGRRRLPCRESFAPVLVLQRSCMKALSSPLHPPFS